ncbi:hypothetical protein [Kibdelosporangium aridum]|uniref:Uncharacterized protein n=1 Tax=Kibdelosporangium aridum TaxID=2030 RepID=A0A1W2FYM1_KIBAR|nr:hypothetical protein [Kibdelosporangium aridum]SMD26953.1 hypothetical protein SAMN05661093_10540 [Kibdelosporangium aridum]
MTDLEMLRNALAERASRAPDVDVVLANATHDVRRLRSRRKATALAGTVAVATGALVAGVTLINQPGPNDPGQPRQPDTGVQAATTPSPAKPKVIRPQLPFTVTIPAGYQVESWSVGDSGAILDFKGSGGLAQAALLNRVTPSVKGSQTTQTTQTTVRGIPAQLEQISLAGGHTYATLTWELIPGKSALVQGNSEQQARSIAESMTTEPSELPSTGQLASLPAGLLVSYWGRGNVSTPLAMLCPERYSDKNKCAQVYFNNGTVPNEVNISIEGEKAPLGAPDADGVRQTPDGRRLARQVDPGHWVEATSGTSTTAAQLRELVLAASAG